MADKFEDLPVIPQPWAGGGQRQDPIPPDATGTNRASYQEGWPEITSTPISQGGIPPNRLDFNGLGNLVTLYLYAFQKGQYITYSSEVVNKIGGYPKGSILWYVANGVPQYLVQSLVNNNMNSNLADTTAWQPLTISPMGMAMLGTLSDVMAPQLRNIQIVNQEPATGVNGTIYGIIES